jgi:hypothetical protein
VKRWVKLYREHGEAGLATLIRRKSGGRTDQRWLELARDVMAENVDLSRPNMKCVMQQTNARLDHSTGPA